MTKYKVLATATTYWRPGEDYLRKIVEAIDGKIADRDFVVVSEKAISTALNNIVDESAVKPTLTAKLIAVFWMRMIWGHFLGYLCHFRGRLLRNMREFPLDVGGCHKQVVLQHANFSQVLMFGSEDGIDGSNLPYSYVSLPLKNGDEFAHRIRAQILKRLRKKVFVLIVDTDKTYSFRNFHFSPRSKKTAGIHSCCGVVAYVLGRTFRLKKRATPVAVAGCRISAEEALGIAEVANRARGFGAGRTVWDMADRFKVGLASVSWEMLETVKHKPIVIVRSKR